MLVGSGASAGGQRIVNLGEYNRLVLDHRRSRGQARRGERHNQIDVRLIVFLQNLWNQSDFALGMIFANLQVFAFGESRAREACFGGR